MAATTTTTINPLNPINPPIDSTGVDAASLVNIGAGASEAMNQIFYKNLNSVLPTWQGDIIGTSKQSLEAVKGLADQLMTGDLSAEMKNSILRTRAELGISRGVFGEATQFASANDMGKSSMEMRLAGADLMTKSVSPLTSKLLENAMALSPSSKIDPSSMFSSILQAQAARNSLMVDVAKTNLETEKWNAEVKWDQYMAATQMQREDAYNKMAFDNASAQLDKILKLYGSANETTAKALTGANFGGYTVGGTGIGAGIKIGS